MGQGKHEYWIFLPLKTRGAFERFMADCKAIAMVPGYDNFKRVFAVAGGAWRPITLEEFDTYRSHFNSSKCIFDGWKVISLDSPLTLAPAG